MLQHGDIVINFVATIIVMINDFVVVNNVVMITDFVVVIVVDARIYVFVLECHL